MLEEEVAVIDDTLTEGICLILALFLNARRLSTGKH